MFYYSATEQEDAYVPVFQPNSSAQEVGPDVLETNSRYPRANGAKRRSGRKPGARVTNFVLAELKVVARDR